MSRHTPVVTDYTVRPPTYPEGHWMNRFWGPLVRLGMALASRIPFYRYVLRPEPAAAELLRQGGPVVFACLHQDILDTYLGLPKLVHRHLTAIVSRSRDGDLAAAALHALGYHVVRGSSSSGGAEGLLQLRARLQSGGSILMACDGPRGPLGDVKPGVVRLAGSVGVPIIPVRSWGLVRVRFLHSWTRAAFTFPLSTVAVCLGAPIQGVPMAADPRPVQLAVAASLADLAARANAWSGGPARAPFKVAGR